jgi:hypothetical protein
MFFYNLNFGRKFLIFTEVLPEVYVRLTSFHRKGSFSGTELFVSACIITPPIVKEYALKVTRTRV